MNKYYETNKLNKDYYKSKGICINCFNEQAEPNKVLCWECAEKDRLRVRTYDKERKKQYNKRKKELCDAFGICTTCMKRKKFKGKQCIHCYMKRHKEYRDSISSSDKLPKELWVEFDKCMVCGEDRVEGHKLCAKHLEVARNNAATARSFINREDHIWKKEINSSVLYTQTYKARLSQKSKAI